MTHDFGAIESTSRYGWWIIKQRVSGSLGPWEVVATAFGERRKEIALDALRADDKIEPGFPTGIATTD